MPAARWTRTALLAAALALVTAVPAAAALPVPAPADGTALYGVHLDWSTDSLAAYTARTGLAPAAAGEFAHLPMTDAERTGLSGRVDALAAAGARLFLTVEPGALSSVTPASADALATTLAGYNARGVPVLLRFAHEMNGSWYAWGQQPEAYVSAFRTVAAAVHAKAPQTAMVWAPNYGGGYPYTGGAHAAMPGTAAHRLLDTDGDGVLSMADDPYTPYYPGDDAVDWVGLTLYHFGHAWPYGENEVPEAGKLLQQVRGTYTGNGRYEDQSALPDFYAAHAVGRGKPMALAETGALWNATTATGAAEADVKTAWLEQVYGAETRSALPLLQSVNWFEIRKHEGEAGGTVDWRSTFQPEVLARLRSLVGSGGYRFAPTTPVTAVAPGPVTGLVLTTTPGRLRAGWQPPAAVAGAVVTGYRVCLGTSCTTTSAPSASWDVVRKTRVTVTVQALGAAGAGPVVSASTTTK